MLTLTAKWSLTNPLQMWGQGWVDGYWGAKHAGHAELFSNPQVLLICYFFIIFFFAWYSPSLSITFPLSLFMVLLLCVDFLFLDSHLWSDFILIQWHDLWKPETYQLRILIRYLVGRKLWILKKGYRTRIYWTLLTLRLFYTSHINA